MVRYSVVYLRLVIKVNWINSKKITIVIWSNVAKLKYSRSRWSVGLIAFWACEISSSYYQANFDLSALCPDYISIYSISPIRISLVSVSRVNKLK
jgi:hypothetical protein